MDLNKVMFIGNIVSDPETRATNSGQNVTSFRIATNRRWKNKETGELQEDAQFHNLVTWGRLADIASQYLSKGAKVYVEGRLNHRNWEDKQGQKKYWTEVVVENLIMLDKKGINNGPADNGAPVNSNQAPDNKASVPTPEEIPTIDVDADKEEVKIEDIPF